MFYCYVNITTGEVPTSSYWEVHSDEVLTNFPSWWVNRLLCLYSVIRWAYTFFYNINKEYFFKCTFSPSDTVTHRVIGTYIYGKH